MRTARSTFSTTTATASGACRRGTCGARAPRVAAWRRPGGPNETSRAAADDEPPTRPPTFAVGDRVEARFGGGPTGSPPGCAPSTARRAVRPHLQRRRRGARGGGGERAARAGAGGRRGGPAPRGALPRGRRRRRPWSLDGRTASTWRWASRRCRPRTLPTSAARSATTRPGITAEGVGACSSPRRTPGSVARTRSSRRAPRPARPWPGSSRGAPLAVGAPIEAVRGGDAYYPGTVAAANADGTYAVDYSDGDREAAVPPASSGGWTRAGERPGRGAAGEDRGAVCGQRGGGDGAGRGGKRGTPAPAGKRPKRPKRLGTTARQHPRTARATPSKPASGARASGSRARSSASTTAAERTTFSTTTATGKSAWPRRWCARPGPAAASSRSSSASRAASGATEAPRGSRRRCRRCTATGRATSRTRTATGRSAWRRASSGRGPTRWTGSRTPGAGRCDGAKWANSGRRGSGRRLGFAKSPNLDGWTVEHRRGATRIRRARGRQARRRSAARRAKGGAGIAAPHAPRTAPRIDPASRGGAVGARGRRVVPGRVARDARGGADCSYDIVYEDGDAEDAVEASRVRTPREGGGDFAEGDPVEARYGGGAQWFPGMISRKDTDRGTYDVMYYDGDRDRTCRRHSSVRRTRGRRRGRAAAERAKPGARGPGRRARAEALAEEPLLEGSAVRARVEARTSRKPPVANRPRRRRGGRVRSRAFGGGGGPRPRTRTTSSLTTGRAGGGCRTTTLRCSPRRRPWRTRTRRAGTRRGSRGMTVEALFNGGNRWFAGNVGAARGDGTFDVVYQRRRRRASAGR